MEKEISNRLLNCITNKTMQLCIYKEQRRDLDDILEKGHEFVQTVCLNV